LSQAIILSLCIISLFGLVFRQREKLSPETLIFISLLPLLLWVVGYFTGFWFAPVVAFGCMIIFYAVFFLIFTIIPTWFSSILFVVFGVAGILFTPGVFADISLTSRYLLMAI
jgi:hypothetical protein